MSIPMASMLAGSTVSRSRFRRMGSAMVGMDIEPLPKRFVDQQQVAVPPAQERGDRMRKSISSVAHDGIPQLALWQRKPARHHAAL